MHELLLSIVTPLQELLAETRPTHSFINRHAAAILAADGYAREAAWLEANLAEMCAGSDWADSGWKCVGHLYDPDRQTGLRGWPNAVESFRSHWDDACRYFRAADPRAPFYLGAAAHLVQDVCVPHHALAKPFGGHKEFEAYAERYRHRFVAHGGGIYYLSDTPEGWVIQNAVHAKQHYPFCVSSHFDRRATHQAIGDLLPRAQRSTAGFVAYFLAVMEVQH